MTIEIANRSNINLNIYCLGYGCNIASWTLSNNESINKSFIYTETSENTTSMIEIVYVLPRIYYFTTY
jgi:hypothetical protein